MNSENLCRIWGMRVLLWVLLFYAVKSRRIRMHVHGWGRGNRPGSGCPDCKRGIGTTQRHLYVGCQVERRGRITGYADGVGMGVCSACRHYRSVSLSVQDNFDGSGELLRESMYTDQVEKVCFEKRRCRSEDFHRTDMGCTMFMATYGNG